MAPSGADRVGLQRVSVDLTKQVGGGQGVEGGTAGQVNPVRGHVGLLTAFDRSGLELRALDVALTRE